MIDELLDIFDNSLFLAILEDSLDAEHKLKLTMFIKAVHIVVQILHQHVSHTWIVFHRPIHQQHRRLNKHDA